MKTILMISVALTVAISFAAAEEKKTFGERAGETLDKAAESTKKAGRAAVDTTKKAAGAVTDAVTPDKDLREINVRLVDDKIQMPKEIESGKTAFVVTNAGNKKHNFEIEGQGLDKKFFLNVDPNETKTMKVDLKPGDYKVSCPVGDHEEHGMKMNLKVK